MAPPKQKNASVMDTLPPADRVTLANFETYKSSITCPKCINKGTIIYIGNTNASNPHPLFSCTACQQKISISSMQHEITQAKASGAIPIDNRKRRQLGNDTQQVNANKKQQKQQQQRKYLGIYTGNRKSSPTTSGRT
ncbi:uncharacterized protein EV154DRAFT_488582 [Mucor mucedo]|uniref:uncharacterized protein n=1 Tax=Mucor mucedo TaxID=29922 RepID=UPI00221EF9BE|nr:uncharacterized protein EV154DRAFT_488582 [Mucor mucedo]KAI7866212.1 hypothetical protein EV154DRAFT_488582 [Mucor mucedo]